MNAGRLGRMAGHHLCMAANDILPLRLVVVISNQGPGPTLCEDSYSFLTSRGRFHDQPCLCRTNRLGVGPVDRTAYLWCGENRKSVETAVAVRAQLEEHRDRSAPPCALAGHRSAAPVDRSGAICRDGYRAGCRHRFRLVVVHRRGRHSLNTDSTEAIGQASDDDDDGISPTASNDRGHGTSHPHRLRSGSADIRIQARGVAGTDPDCG